MTSQNTPETNDSENLTEQNCSENCSENSGQASKSSNSKKPIISRRSLCIGLGGTAVLAALGFCNSTAIAGPEKLVRPPGGQDENRLISACIRCEKCYEVCPQSAIAPAHIEDGLVNMRTPVMSYNDSYCDWCAQTNNGVPKCVEACPTEALALPEGATKENTILGVASINPDWCLAYKLIGCKFCYDACPYDAIEMDEQMRPTVIEERCNGCGACEAACVSLKNGSISSGATSRAIVVVPSKE